MIGRYVRQPSGYKAFVPDKFPLEEKLRLNSKVVGLLSKADVAVGKLDGVTQLLPDLDFFIFMYVRKEAALSTQIEGTKATMVDAIKADAKFKTGLPEDVDDILHYIQAMKLGLRKLESIPLSLRLIKEVHKTLLSGGRQSHYSDPGNFRRTQNWIGGNSPATAQFVPPPPAELARCLGDMEKFFHEHEEAPVLVKAALIHAQFETIHPFLDGNGRVGRLLVTFYLCHQNILERPTLYLSEYFKANRETYFDLLDAYHQKGEVDRWLSFFLEGVAEVAADAVETSKKISKLYQRDLRKTQSLGKSAKKGADILVKLYKQPVVDVNTVKGWLDTSRATANAYVNKMAKLGVLRQQDESVEYGRVFEYGDYLDIFRD